MPVRHLGDVANKPGEALVACRRADASGGHHPARTIRVKAFFQTGLAIHARSGLSLYLDVLQLQHLNGISLSYSLPFITQWRPFLYLARMDGPLCQPFVHPVLLCTVSQEPKAKGFQEYAISRIARLCSVITCILS